MNHTHAPEELIDSPFAAWRLLTTLCLVTLGSSCMYVVAVVLAPVQAEFGIGRANAALPYTLMMICLGFGGIWTGKLADKYGISPVLWIGSLAVAAGFVVAGMAPNIWVFGLAHGLLLGLIGSSSTFAPLMADTSLWWGKEEVLLWQFVPAVTMWLGLFGRPWLNGELRRLGGGTPTSQWVCFVVGVWHYFHLQ